MKEVSKELKEKMKDGTAEYEIKIIFMNSDITDVVETLTGGDITEFTYNAGSCREQFSIGCFQAAAISFSIPVAENSATDWRKFRFSDVGSVIFAVYAMIKESENTEDIMEMKKRLEQEYADKSFEISKDRTQLFEAVEMGNFYIDEKINENDSIQIKCSDAAIKFDGLLYNKYFSALKTLQSEGQIKMPVDMFLTSVLEASGVLQYIDELTVEQIGELSGVEYNGTTKPAVLPSEISIPQALKLRGKTCREMLMMFCEAYGCFCYISPEGFLRFKQYQKSSYAGELTEDEMFSFEYDGTVKLTGIKAAFENIMYVNHDKGISYAWSYYHLQKNKI